jgi:NTE family protein
LSGSRVQTVVPNGDGENLFGVDAMDPALRAPAVRAGFEQGSALAGLLAAFWR